MATLYPVQDAFTRGEISPRLHSRASLDLYRGALARCLNLLTLPHGGIRRRGGTYFVGEVKTSSKATRLIPFIFSSEQAYALEVGDFYLRVYAYGARVGTVEVVTPWPEADLDALMFYQSADQMWIVHPDYAVRLLTRTAHTTWTLDEYVLNDGPYGDLNDTSTTLTPSSYGSFVPAMSSNTTPSGTASSSGSATDAWQAFDKNPATTTALTSSTTGTLTYHLASGSKVCDAYWLQASSDFQINEDMPTQWTVEGSNNGSSWVVLDRQINQAAWQPGEIRFFEFENKAAFSYIRLNFSGGGKGLASGSDTVIAEWEPNEAGDGQTPFNLTASSTTGINGGTGFQTTDVGRTIRLLGSDGKWRWARIAARSSSTVVTVRMYGHALPDLRAATAWHLGTFIPGDYPEAVQVFEERLAFSRRFSAFLSKSFVFDDFGPGEADDDAMVFTNAGGGQANDIVWLADADGYLLIATTGGVRALSGSGIDEALTPSSFKNRKSRTFGAARVRPVDAGLSFLYLTRSRKSIAELVMNQYGRFQSDDVGQISEHIPKKGVVEIAFQSDPDPVLWFPLQNGELGGYTHQPSQEVRGMHRHNVGGVFTGSSWPVIERCIVTPGQSGADDVWLIVKRTIGGSTKRYIELLTAPLEDGEIEDAFSVDCGLTYSGSATGTLSGLSHLEGQSVDVLATSAAGATKVFAGLTVSSGAVTLPDSFTATKAHVGLPFSSEADTLELDVGGKDGSIIGRRKKVTKVILSLLETDVSGLQITSLIKTRWEPVRIPTVVAANGTVSLFTGNVDVPIDDSWEGQGRVRIRHTKPTPLTIRSVTPVFDAEP